MTPEQNIIIPTPDIEQNQDEKLLLDGWALASYVTYWISSALMFVFAAIYSIILFAPNSEFAWLGLLFLIFFPVAIAFYATGITSLIFAIKRIRFARNANSKLRFVDLLIIVIFVISILVPASIETYNVKVRHPRQDKLQTARDQELKNKTDTEYKKSMELLFGTGNSVYLPANNQDFEIKKAYIGYSQDKPIYAGYDIFIKKTNQLIDVSVTNSDLTNSTTIANCATNFSQQYPNFSKRCTAVKSTKPNIVIYRAHAKPTEAYKLESHYAIRIDDTYYSISQPIPDNTSLSSIHEVSADEVNQFLTQLKLQKIY